MPSLTFEIAHWTMPVHIPDPAEFPVPPVHALHCPVLNVFWPIPFPAMPPDLLMALNWKGNTSMAAYFVLN